jgi:LDH2 family malate/lactate/ureidoglycolate dehydrogenase
LTTAADQGSLLRIRPADHLAFVTAVFVSLGASEEVAEQQALQLLEGDLRGHPSHGLRRLDILVQRVQNGVADPAAVPALEWVTPGVLTVDGRGGLGPPTAITAVMAMLDNVSERGIVMAAVRNANHLGMLAPYVEQMARRGAVGIAMTTSEALVHPWGGKVAMVGTNPLAIAVPNGSEPVVLDMATGQVSMGKVLDYAARGLPLPDGAAIDADGNPTNDALAARDGAISPFGGAKGYALAVVLELLVGILTRTDFGRDVRGTLDGDEPCNKGDVFIAIDLASMGASTEAAASYLEALRSMAPADGFGPVTIPGDRARRTRDQNWNDGVPIAAATWAMVSTLASRLDVPLPTPTRVGS